MTREQFEIELRKLFTPHASIPEDDQRRKEATELIEAALIDTEQYVGKPWDEDRAAERFKQWRWVHHEINKPKTFSLSESTLHRMYQDYLKERSYSANKIPEKKGKKTPDFLVVGNSLEFLNEFKAPELIFNKELNLYKFQTTHSKVLTFISKAVKQLNTEDPGHKKPWLTTFASTHFQLNWTDFIQTLQGGVAYDNKLSPDFTDTEVFKRVIAKAKEVDLYIWLQINPTDEHIYQVSFIINKNSAFLEEIKKFVSDMKTKDVSSMDNLYYISWPT